MLIKEGSILQNTFHNGLMQFWSENLSFLLGLQDRDESLGLPEGSPFQMETAVPGSCTGIY